MRGFESLRAYQDRKRDDHTVISLSFILKQALLFEI